MSVDSERATEDLRRAAIHAAAIAEFSARGFAATSMANIADAAGMSRPALYQYFRNKGDIFASAFAALLNEAVDRSLAALDQPGSTAEQLDGFLQRFDGDLWEQTAASPHNDEMLSAKHEHAADAAADITARLRKGLASYLDLAAIGSGSADAAERRAGWAEILELAPKGFKFDQPSVTTYRRRLSALARSVAADIALASPDSRRT